MTELHHDGEHELVEKNILFSAQLLQCCVLVNTIAIKFYACCVSMTSSGMCLAERYKLVRSHGQSM
jgi:hypothetical protein